MSDDESLHADQIRLETSKANRLTGWLRFILGIHIAGVDRLGDGCSADCVGEFEVAAC